MGAGVSTRPRAIQSALVALALTGCATPAARYAGSRALDLFDVFPLSGRSGVGLYMSARATPFLGAGIGAYDALACGMGPRRWGPVWEEEGSGIGPVYCVDESLLSRRGKDLANSNLIQLPEWPAGPDALFEEAPGWRSRGHVALVLPYLVRRDGDWAKLPPWYSLLDCEADAFIGVIGLRIGFSPGEIVDFLAGLFGLDPSGDDIGGRRDRERDAKRRGTPSDPPQLRREAPSDEGSGSPAPLDAWSEAGRIQSPATSARRPVRIFRQNGMTARW